MHLRLSLPDGDLRLDLLGIGAIADTVVIEPIVDFGRALQPQLASLARLEALIRGECRTIFDPRLVRLVEALRVADALAAGASLRAIGLGVFGDDWPGDGEHLKSRVRRRIELSRQLMYAGSAGVLAGSV